MSITYTVTEVTKEFVKVKYENNREAVIPIKTWVDKDWIEAHIRQAFNEVDEGSIEDIPLKVGDKNTIMTLQEGEKLHKDARKKQIEYNESLSFDYKLIRRIGYPFINDSVGALIKAVLTGDKTELETLNVKIEEVKNGNWSKEDNPLKNSPHTVETLTQENWNHPYSRQIALANLSEKTNKYFPPVGRIDNVYGDRNLVCSCPPMEAYELEKT